MNPRTESRMNAHQNTRTETRVNSNLKTRTETRMNSNLNTRTETRTNPHLETRRPLTTSLTRLLVALLSGALLSGCGGTSSAPANSSGAVPAPAPAIASTATDGNVQIRLNSVPQGAASVQIDVLDPETMQPIRSAVTVPASQSQISLSGVEPGNWRIRVTSLDAAATSLSSAFAFASTVNDTAQLAIASNDFIPRGEPTPTPVPSPPPQNPDPAALQQVCYFIIVYMENQSYDAIFPDYPDGNGVAHAGRKAVQRVNGAAVPGYVYNNEKDVFVNSSIIGNTPTAKYPLRAPAKPYAFNTRSNVDQPVVPVTSLVGDTIHQWVNEQRQIDRDQNGVGQMDQYAAWSNNPAAVEGHYDSQTLRSPLYLAARQGVLCDHFFHSAYGNTWHNEFWFISGATPIWTGPTKSDDFINEQATSKTDPTLERALIKRGDINYIVQFPANFDKGPIAGTSVQTAPTIGDRLDQRGVCWTWYGSADYEINPFIWFQNYLVNSSNFKLHFKTKNPENAVDFVNDVKNNALSPVSFVRPNLSQSEHPDLSTYQAGQDFIQTVVSSVQSNKAIWDHCAIIITFDENGGRWDHVSPPPQAADGFGPGTRIPTVIVSPFVQAGTVDHTRYETVSILKTLQVRYGLGELTPRVRDAADLRNAFVNRGGGAPCANDHDCLLRPAASQ